MLFSSSDVNQCYSQVQLSMLFSSSVLAHEVGDHSASPPRVGSQCRRLFSKPASSWPSMHRSKLFSSDNAILKFSWMLFSSSVDNSILKFKWQCYSQVQLALRFSSSVDSAILKFSWHCDSQVQLNVIHAILKFKSTMLFSCSRTGQECPKKVMQLKNRRPD